MKELGVADEPALITLEAYQLEIDRLRLRFGDHGRSQSMAVEVRDYSASYENSSAGYRLFKASVAMLARVLPPRRFYAIREWYTRKDLKRYRDRVAPAAANLRRSFQRRPVTRVE